MERSFLLEQRIKKFREKLQDKNAEIEAKNNSVQLTLENLQNKNEEMETNNQNLQNKNKENER